jgi:hypothetical protein
MSYGAEPVPAILGFLTRPDVRRALAAEALDRRVVHVHGPRGIGKRSSRAPPTQPEVPRCVWVLRA